jgi:predicted ribosomally synthesized peptide with SipW-like signal peptide
MKKIITSLSLVVAVAAAVIGATTAYFTDETTVKGNNFTAGTLSIDAKEGDSHDFSVELADMVPGEWSQKKSLPLVNSGSLDLMVDSIKVGDLGEKDKEFKLEDTRNKEQCWGAGTRELNGELKVQVDYDEEDRAVFKAWMPSDYPSEEGLMTFAFDVDTDGEADIQIQWNKDGNQEWKYAKVVNGNWEDWSQLSSDFTAGKRGNYFWLKTPIEFLGGYDSEYKFGVDANKGHNDPCQTFYSTDDEHLWYNGDNYESSEYYVPMTTISEENMNENQVARNVNVRIHKWDDLIYNGTLYDLKSTDAINKNSEKQLIGPTNTFNGYGFEFELDDGVGNQFQGDGVEAVFEVGASQVK